jgi:hypothetical protein
LFLSDACDHTKSGLVFRYPSVLAETKWLPKITYQLKTGPVFQWHLKTGPDCIDHMKTKLKILWFSDVSLIQMSGFQIPNVIKIELGQI